MRVFSWNLRKSCCTKTCLISLVSELVKVCVGTHFPAFKETDADDTKLSLDSQRSKSPQSFADLVIYVKLVIGRGNGDVVK